MRNGFINSEHEFTRSTRSPRPVLPVGSPHRARSYAERHLHLGLVALGEDGVVGLEVVLFEEFGGVDDLHVEERVAHGEEEDLRASHCFWYWFGWWSERQEESEADVTNVCDFIQEV